MSLKVGDKVLGQVEYGNLLPGTVIAVKNVKSGFWIWKRDRVKVAVSFNVIEEIPILKYRSAGTIVEEFYEEDVTPISGGMYL